MPGGKCISCPPNTVSNEDGMGCDVVDVLFVNDKVFHAHQLVRPDLFCIKESNQYLVCDRSSSQVGPITVGKNTTHQNSVFFFSSRQPLNTSRYEFHQSRSDPEMMNKHSFVYMLFDV